MASCKPQHLNIPLWKAQSGSSDVHSSLICWPGGGNSRRFLTKVTSRSSQGRSGHPFRYPKARCYASKVDNNHPVLPACHSLDRDQFLPLQDMWFGSENFWLTQSQKTLASAKALQYWAEKTQPPIPGEPNQLAESVLEHQWMMDPLSMFMDKEVLEDVPPSNWVKIMPSRLVEPTQ